MVRYQKEHTTVIGSSRGRRLVALGRIRAQRRTTLDGALGAALGRGSHWATLGARAERGLAGAAHATLGPTVERVESDERGHRLLRHHHRSLHEAARGHATLQARHVANLHRVALHFLLRRQFLTLKQRL